MLWRDMPDVLGRAEVAAHYPNAAAQSIQATCTGSLYTW
jgi:hypothetical protein